MVSFKAVFIASVIGVLLTAPVLRQQAPDAAQTKPAAQTRPPAQAQPAPQPTAARGPDYVEEKGFKVRMFEVKYLDPIALARAVSALGSGFKGATVSTNPG